MLEEKSNMTDENGSPDDIERSPARKKRLLRWTLYSLLALSILACAAVVAGYIYAGDILEIYVFPAAAREAGFKTFSATVERADAGGLEVADVKLGDAIDLDHLDIRLSEGLLDSIQLDGLDIRAVLTDGGVALPGLFREKKTRTRTPLIPAIPFLTGDFSVRARDSRISLAPLNAAGQRRPKLDFPFDFKASLEPGAAKFELDSMNPSFSSGENAFSAGKISIAGKAVDNGGNASASISAEVMAASAALGPIRIANCAFGSPLFLRFRSKGGIALSAPPDGAKPGRLVVGSIAFKGRRMASADIAIRQDQKGAVLLDGVVDGPSRRFRFPVSAKITAPNLLAGEISATANINFDTGGTDVDLGGLDKAAKGFRFNGSITATAKFNRKNGLNALQASASVNAEKISANNGLGVENVKLDLKLGGEKVAGTAGFPKGVLSFGRLVFGKITVDSGSVVFQIEPNNVLFVERAKFAVCGGHMESDAFRVSADYAKKFDITFYCSKMNVAEVLNALNIGHASGVGAVSGRIPVKIDKRLVSIDDGFLNSAPGEGGNIKLIDFMGPMAFVAGYAQLDIVREALKDFNYDWLRISLKSFPKTDSLIVKLTMSGAPAHDLPFGFDEKKGGFHLTSDPNTSAHFQKMTFEINFILPGHLAKLPK